METDKILKNGIDWASSFCDSQEECMLHTHKVWDKWSVVCEIEEKKKRKQTKGERGKGCEITSKKVFCGTLFAFLLTSRFLIALDWESLFHLFPGQKI